MNRQTCLQAEFVEFIPEQLEAGKLYISYQYSTAVHLCCCGCGLEVVTPLNHAKWYLTQSNGLVSLCPSIGNWSFPCQSHYWIVKNRVYWATILPAELISSIQERDRQASESQPKTQGRKYFRSVHQYVVTVWTNLVRQVRRLL